MPETMPACATRVTQAEKFLLENRPGTSQFFGAHDVRKEFIRRFGFSILNGETIECLRPWGPFLEVGAGSGYWAWELQQAGIDIIPTDPGGRGFRWKEPWLASECLSGDVAVKKYPLRTLLLCWPSYAEPWAFETLKAYTGDTLVYVGEGSGGCTGDDAFHELLGQKWEELDCIKIPTFPYVHDQLIIYRRKAHGR